MIFVSVKSLVQHVYIVPAVQIVLVPVARDLRRFLPAVIVSPLSNKKAALRRLCALCEGVYVVIVPSVVRYSPLLIKRSIIRLYRSFSSGVFAMS